MAIQVTANKKETKANAVKKEATADMPLSFYYSVSYGDYESPVSRHIVEAVLYGTTGDNVFYDSKGRLNCYSAQKGDDALKLAKAIAGGPTINIYLNNSPSLASYTEAIGKDGVKSFQFCTKYITENINKYLRCFLSRRDYYVNKNSIKPSFSGLNGRAKEAIRLNPISLSNHKDSDIIIKFRRASVGFSLWKKDESIKRTCLIPMLSIKFGDRSGKSILSISSYVLLVVYLVRALLFTVCPYADGEGNVTIKPEDEIVKLLGFNSTLVEKRNNLIKIMSGDFSNYNYGDEKLLDKSLLDSYVSMLKKGLVFNRIFREYVDYDVTKIKAIPAIFLARKFKCAK